jgi:hypothetical protein
VYLQASAGDVHFCLERQELVNACFSFWYKFVADCCQLFPKGLVIRLEEPVAIEGSSRAFLSGARRFELLKILPERGKAIVLECINAILTKETVPPASWLGGMIRFLFKKGDLLDASNYRPVCLQDCVYKLLSAILTDRLYRLSEQHGLIDASQEGFRRLHSTQRQVQSLHCGPLRLLLKRSRSCL